MIDHIIDLQQQFKHTFKRNLPNRIRSPSFFHPEILQCQPNLLPVFRPLAQQQSTVVLLMYLTCSLSLSEQCLIGRSFFIDEIKQKRVEEFNWHYIVRSIEYSLVVGMKK